MPSSLVTSTSPAPDPRSKNGPPALPLLFWRIVFTQQLFMIQITNNFGGPRLAWITVTTGEEIEYRIPESYLHALNSLGSVERLINREVLERRAVPAVFRSYDEARSYALETMHLPAQNEWHPDAVHHGTSWWGRLFRRA